MPTKNRVEKRGEKYYLYSLTPYWDPEKKQGRQKKVYLGPCDADGNLQEGRRNVQHTEAEFRPYRSVTVGPYDLLYKLSERNRMRSRLEEVFGEEDALRILSLAILRITDPDSLRTVKDTVETTSLELEIGPGTYDSQRLSELLERIGRNDSGRSLFYESCLEEDDVAVFDTSVLSSSSKSMDCLEYGRKARKTGLPQVNLGLVHSLRTGLPVLMKMFPGSISDTTTVKNLVMTLKSMGSKKVVLIMDRGFYSESNIAFLASRDDCRFLIPVKGRTDLYKELITASKDDLENPLNMFSFGDRTEFYSDKIIDWPYETPALDRDGNRIGKIRAVAFLNTEREKEERDTFVSKMEEAERLAADTEWKGEASAVSDIFRGRLEGMEAHFDIAEGDDGKVSLKRRRNSMTFAMRNFGKVVFITNMDDDPKEILALYKKRDEDEKEFETLKDDMDGGIQYVHSLDAAKGLLFIQFIGLSIRMHMRASMDGEMKALGIPLILKRLRSLTATELRTGWIINEVPKKCRLIYEHFDLSLPDESSLK